MSNTWRKRTTFGWWRTEDDMRETLPFAFNDGERIIYGYMENEHYGSMIVIFEKEGKVFFDDLILAFEIDLKSQWAPLGTTWKEIAQEDHLRYIKPFGARKKLLWLLVRHGVTGEPLITAIEAMFPEQVGAAKQPESSTYTLLFQ